MRIFKQGDAELEFVQLYGERNSATTYLARLLQDNMRHPRNLLGLLKSDVTPLGEKIFGYKHWFINSEKLQDPRAQNTLFVVIYRNPYSWVRAMMDRPYALEKSIGGRSVKDLDKIKLTGHIKGRDTKNEFDPKTGAQLTLFELRTKKIASFEALKGKVGNLAFINLEELLARPQTVMNRLKEHFPSAFADEVDTSRKPFPQLKQEFDAPPAFDQAELKLITKGLDWNAEEAIGYARESFDVHAVPDLHMVILHGGSSVGKSHIMRALVEANPKRQVLEMDDCQYWNEQTPKLTIASLEALFPETSQQLFEEFHKIMGTKGDKKSRCVNYLLNRLHEFQRSDAPPEEVIATCGALPDPGTDSIYQWLSARLPIRFEHLLIDISEDAHLEQIKKRGRMHLKDEILRLHTKKKSSASRFDAVITNADEAEAYLTPPAQKVHNMSDLSQFTPRAPNVRLHKADLTHIQIYGERNSGTKHLTQLVARHAIEPDNILGSYANKKDPVNKAKMIGYKHYYPRPDKLSKHQHKTLFLVIYKNPYTWIRSMMGKPYHFRDCLEGKSILDLPDLKLAGFDIHGREIPDLHPDTGERITMFGLRKHKILQWENLARLVDNVAYVNYEDLLVSPTKVVNDIKEAWSGLFVKDGAEDYVPDPKYLKKYVSPKPFETAEMEAMDAHIDWAAEALAGYERGNLFIPDKPVAR